MFEQPVGFQEMGKKEIFEGYDSVGEEVSKVL
jgi:hypothetical protein